jgi:ribonuclease BN (tRNA processing enzyme)
LSDRYQGVLAAASAKSGTQLHLEDVDAFLITHLHGDHVNGLESVAFYRRFRENRKVEVWAQEQVLNDLWDKRLKVAMEPLFDGTDWGKNRCEQYFEFNKLRIGEITQIGPFSVESYLTLHHLPASALKITVGESSVGYSGDTRFDPKLIEFLKPADLIFHETNVGPGHTAYEKLAALPESLRQKIRLVHFQDDFEEEPSVIQCAKDGEVFRL